MLVASTVAATAAGLPGARVATALDHWPRPPQPGGRWFRVASSGREGAQAGLPDTKAQYERRFGDVDLTGAATGCAALEGSAPAERPLWVFVHGIGGDGEEWREAVPLVDSTAPAAMYMFRWSQLAPRDRLVAELAGGLRRLLACAEASGREVVLYAHSAGGVLSAMAAGRLVDARRAATPRVYLITVASPLAGIGRQDDRPDGSAAPAFLIDLGSNIVSYDPGPTALLAAHLRTTYPADKVMAPSVGGHLPNRRGVGVPGAFEIDLPEDVGHVEALLWVSQEIALGHWRAWLDPAKHTPSAPPRPSERPTVCTLREDLQAAGDLVAVPSLDEPPPAGIATAWNGETLPERLPSPESYVRCRPCACDGERIQPWREWTEINERAYARLRRAAAPYPVAIVPGFLAGGPIPRFRMSEALQLLRHGWVAALIASGGHRRGGNNEARQLLELAKEIGAAQGIDVTDRVFVEPCATGAVTNLRNGLRMMAALGLPRGLLVTDSKVSGQAWVYYHDIDALATRELRCVPGRMSYLVGDGALPRLDGRDNACQPPLSVRNNPLGFAWPGLKPSIFWVSPRSFVGGKEDTALSCRGGSPELVAQEPDDEDPFGPTCLPEEGNTDLDCGAVHQKVGRALRKWFRP